MPRTDQLPTGLYGATASRAAQRRAFINGHVPVAVYGLGKMGLPLATVYAATSGNVTGVDIDESVVAAISDGDCPVENEPGLATEVERTVEAGYLTATTDTAVAAADASIHVLMVPTLLSGSDPDLRALIDVTREIAPRLDSGDIVLVESTVPPGTCRDVLWPLLDRDAPDDVGLAFCPERTMSGTALQDIRESHPKIVGGVDDESTRVAGLLYGEITDNGVYTARDARTAECVKVFEGLYRDLNIALANELATVADDLDVDVTEAIDLANTQPFCDIHDPGIGVGGHCIPVYPYFLLDRVDAPTPLVRTARQINDDMPRHGVQLLEDALADRDTPLSSATVAVLGVTYRPGVDERRFSPAIPVIDALSQSGADVVVVDPICSTLEDVDGRTVAVEDLSAEPLDGAILVTAHDAFDDIDWAALDPMVVVDGRNALSLSATDHRVESIGVGRPTTGPPRAGEN